MNKTNDRIRTTLRLPKEMDNKINEFSRKMGISKNAYIIMLISQTLRDYDQETETA